MSTVATSGATATFTASRGELVGDEILLGSAEIARQVCRRATCVGSVLAVAADRMRRVDLWLDDVAIVTHAATDDVGRRAIGSVCSSVGATDLVTAIVDSLIGGLPDAASTGLDVEVATWSPVSLPVRCGIVVTAGGSTAAQRHVVLADSEGLVGAETRELALATHLTPMCVDDARSLIGRLWPTGHTTIADLLSD